MKFQTNNQDSKFLHVWRKSNSVAEISDLASAIAVPGPIPACPQAASSSERPTLRVRSSRAVLLAGAVVRVGVVVCGLESRELLFLRVGAAAWLVFDCVLVLR